jgi:hypothetical protein
MTYTLEINHINPTENLFFWQTNILTEAQIKNYLHPIVAKHQALGAWADPNYSYYNKTRKIFQRPTGEWQSVNITKNFVSVRAAAEFFKDLIADGTDVRTLTREWQQQHGILNETNILDNDNNIIEVIHSCQAHKCLRFGTCPSQGSGCTVVELTSNNNVYPIYHMK